MWKFLHSSTLSEKIIVGVLGLVILISTFQIGNAFYVENSEPAPDYGGTFVEGVVGEFNFINPLLAQTSLDRDLTSLVFCGLTRFDPISNSIVDDIADHELSADKRTYTFKIKKGVKWHDGVPVTADDVIFTFRDLIQNEKFPNQNIASDFYDVLITKVDDETVTMSLKKQYAFFIYNTTIGLLPKHILGDVPPEELLASDFNLDPIGCGPYKLDSINSNSVKLSAFDKFFRGRPYIDSVIFRIFPDSAELMKNIESVMGTKDLTDEQIRGFTNDARLELHDFTLPQYVGLFFNTDRDILKDKKTRLGLQLATNKDAIISAHKGRVQKIDTPLLEIATSDWKYEFDAARADGALYDAGWRYPETESSSAETDEKKATETTAQPLMSQTKFITAPSTNNFFATDEDEFYIEGNTPPGSSKIIVNGYTLTLFNPSKGTWSYKASASLGTLKEGENSYKIENQDGEIDSITIFYSKDAEKRNDWILAHQNPTNDKMEGVIKNPPAKETKQQPPSLRLRYKDGEPLALKLLMPADREEFLPISEELAKQWMERGVKLTIERLEENEFLNRLNNRDYDIVLFGENLGYNLDAYPFWHSSEAKEGGSNLSNIKSSAINAWLEQIRSGFDSSDRRKRLANLREVLSEEVPAIMLYTPTYSYAIDKKIQNFNLGRIALKRDRLANIATWYLRETRKATGDVGIWSFVKWFFGEAL